MEKLVELYQGKEARVSTFKIFGIFGYSEHRTFKNLITKNKDKFESRGSLFNVSGDTLNRKKGRPDEGYFLNERQFMFLVMLAKNTPESIALKERIEDEFYLMRKQLAQMASVKSGDEWKAKRIDGKAVYKQKTDVIKQFVEYCENAGSKSARTYYTSLAQMENKALFVIEQKYPNVREVLNVKQLGQIMVADQIIEKAMLEEMEKETEYHEIYRICKDRVVQFSEILGKSLVIEMLETKLINKN